MEQVFFYYKAFNDNDRFLLRIGPDNKIDKSLLMFC